MLVYIYDIPGPPGSGTDITARCRLAQFSMKDNAEEGSVAINTLVVDDPDGNLTLLGHRRLYVYETAAPAFDQMVFDGYISNLRVSRGPYRTGAGRIWTLDVADTNVLLNRRIMNGTDANRGAETDLARVQAGLTMTEFNTIDDSLYVNTSAATTAMDAVDYRGQNGGAYMDDCRQATGKNMYVFYREAVGMHSLWYDFATSTAYDSGKYLSNVLADVDQSTVFEIDRDRIYLNIDPSRIASGIYLEYDGGHVYVQDTAVYTTYAAIDWAAPSLNVKSLTKATARANRYLADASTPDEIVHTVMPNVPRALVNAIKKGQIVNFRASHLPGYEDYQRMRLLYRTVTEISEDPQASFEIEMDLTNIVQPAIVQFYTHTMIGGCETSQWPALPGGSHLLIGGLVIRDGTALPSNVVPIGTTNGPGNCAITGEIAGTDWTYIAANDGGGSGHTGALMLSWRNSVVSEPRNISWGSVPKSGGLGGTARPRSHQVEVSGLSGAPTVTVSYAQYGGPGSVFTSPDIVATGAGYIFALLGYRCTGPSDGSSASFVMVERAPAVGLTQGFDYDAFGGYSWFGYLKVSGAGTYNIVLDRSAKPRSNTDEEGYGWIMGAWLS